LQTQYIGLKTVNENRLEESLGFDSIRGHIAGYCLSPQGREMAVRLKMLRSYETVVVLQEQVQECRQLMAQGLSLPENDFFDLLPFTAQLEVEGFVLLENQWSEMSRGLLCIDRAVSLIRKHGAVFPRLLDLAGKVALPADIFFRLSQVFDDEGGIRDSASPELNRIRKQKIDEQSRLRRRLEAALKSVIAQGFIAEDAAITFRNGRMVIPVQAEYKRRVKGFIHDESATGQTVFIEPEDVLELNNAIQELRFAEQREVYRILTALTLAVRPFRKEIAQASHFLGILDLIRAKAKFGNEAGAGMPGHGAGCPFRWYGARHPLLEMAHRRSGKPVVPLTIWLSAEKRILVISGPNAGGKSICLKTVGLIQYMWQAGIPVPVGEGSTMGFFDSIRADIGDQQSLENDLSTYSSHLANMKEMLAAATDRSLILLDEFGTGTDPALGGPIAEAILESLCHKKVYGLVNTHYTNLKNFASRHPLVENAAMKFDSQRLEPLFELEIGQPGSSYALEIAEKIGLPRAVLNQARNKIGIKKINVDKLILELEEEKRRWQTKNEELGNRDRKTKILLQENERRHRELENQKRQIVNEAKEKARNLLEEANRRIEETIRRIREEQADKKQTQTLRAELNTLREKLGPEDLLEGEGEKNAPAQPSSQIRVLDGAPKEGDFVRIKGSASAGVLVGFRGKDAEVQIGEIKTSIRPDRLERVSGLPAETGKSEVRTSTQAGLQAKMMTFEAQLDVRGLRSDEAIKEVDQWLDEALLLGQKELRILHGKGDGILRGQIRRLLKSYRQVENIRDEHADRGGAGVTLFHLNV
jgi:DNA mismatch repair protein MutS2